MPTSITGLLGRLAPDKDLTVSEEFEEDAEDDDEDEYLSVSPASP
jgi:hypothetical protein